MKKKIGNMEYTITPVPPYLSPYFTLISDALKKPPTFIEEAEKQSEEVQKCLQKLFAECIDPQPPPEYTWQVYAALSAVTNQALKEAGFFRKSKGSSPSKSGAVGISASQTTK